MRKEALLGQLLFGDTGATRVTSVHSLEQVWHGPKDVYEINVEEQTKTSHQRLLDDGTVQCLSHTTPGRQIQQCRHIPVGSERLIRCSGVKQ